MFYFIFLQTSFLLKS